MSTKRRIKLILFIHCYELLLLLLLLPKDTRPCSRSQTSGWEPLISSDNECTQMNTQIIEIEAIKILGGVLYSNLLFVMVLFPFYTVYSFASLHGISEL